MTEAIDSRDSTIESLREQQRAISGVLRAVARAEGLQPVLDEVVEATVRLCEGTSAQLYLAEGGLLHAIAYYGQGEQDVGPDYDRQHPHAFDRKTIAGRAAVTKEVAHIPDISADAEYAYSGPADWFRAGLGVPILFEGDLIGVVAVTREAAGSFADEHIELVETFADQAAIAIANARLIEAVERQLEQQRAVSDVLAAVARAEGLESVLHALLEAAARLCDAQFGEVHMIEGELLRLAAGHGGPPELYEYERAHPHPAAGERSTINGRVVLTRDVVQIPDILDDPEYSWPAAAEAGIRALLGAPLLVEGELVGVFNLVRTEPIPYTEEQLELVRTFADQAAIAIANARLIDAVERQLEQQQAVSRVLGAVARSEGLQLVLDAVVEAVTLLSGVENGRLWLVKDGLLHAFANYGLDETYEYDRNHPHPIDRTTMTGRTALARAPVHVPDILEDPEYTYSGPRPYRAVLSVPIMLEEELIGVVGIVRAEPGAFAEQDIALVKTFADQAAIAIANARLIEAVDRQRTELSRFVSPQVAELVSSDEGEKMLAGHRAQISVCFCDLRGFTAFTETAEPEELFEVLRSYHEAIGELIPAHDGTLEHFAGDGLMVFFNDPAPVEEHELQAIRFAVAAQECFGELAAGWAKRGIDLGLGIGIASGYATLGRIGFEGRYDYGALGPVTNLASRLSTAAKPGQVLIGQRLYAAVEERVDAQPVGELDLKGFGRPVVAYEVRSVIESGA